MSEPDGIHPSLKNIPPLPADDPDGAKEIMAMLDRRQAERNASAPDPVDDLAAVGNLVGPRMRRRCVGGSHDGDEFVSGPAPYLHLDHKTQRDRRERYMIVGDQLMYQCDVNERDMPVHDADRKRFGYPLQYDGEL